MKRGVVRPVLAFLAGIALAAGGLAACGDDGGATAPSSTSPSTTEATTGVTGATTVTSPASCGYYDVDGCALYGFVLTEPRPTAEALAAVASLPGVAVAVWRADFACVPQTSMGPPGVEVPTEASRFAYVDAAGIRERRLETSGTVAPPITGMSISESYWNRWEDQWAQAQEPGVLIEAVAVYVPNAVAAGGPVAGIDSVVPLESRRTDTLDPAVYAGELLMVSEEFPAGYLSEAAPPDCG